MLSDEMKTLTEIIEILKELNSDDFYGKVTHSYEKGKLSVIKVELTIKKVN